MRPTRPGRFLIQMSCVGYRSSVAQPAHAGRNADRHKEGDMPNTACPVSRSASVRTFLELLEQRKTRRFGSGMELPAGPLQYKSSLPPLPLTAEEERHLIFAGVGKTGPHTA